MRPLFRKQQKIERKSVEIGPEEIFMDALNSPGFSEETAEGRMERPLGLRPFVIAGAVVLAVLAVFFIRMLDLTILRGAEFRQQSEANRTYSIYIQSPRGLIFDRKYEKLVANAPTFTVYFGAAEPDTALKVLSRLAALFSISLDEIAESNDVSLETFQDASLISKWPQKLFIQSGSLREEILKIRSNPDDFPGVEIEESNQRSYPLAEAATHLVGFTGQPSIEEIRQRPGLRPSELVGKSGVEYWYEEELRGRSGRKLVEVNAAGEVLRERHIERPNAGKNLVLEADAGLQEFAAKTLERHLKALGKKAGAIIMLDPRDGGVRALVSFPQFDANVLGRPARREVTKLLNDSSRPFFNRAVSGGYPSGSTIKPFLAAAALEERLIDPNRQIYDPGFISVPNPFDPERPTIYKDWKPLGLVDMRRALAMSANVYFYAVGGGWRDIPGLGIERIKKWLDRFGWGKVTGIDLPGEYSGLIPDPELKKSIRPQDPIWRIGDTYITAIGQGDLQVTPLQLAVSTAAIANGGKLWQPRVALAVIDENRKFLAEFPPRLMTENVAGEEAIQIVREGMRAAVTQGSAAALADLYFTSAGKTGTAETGAYGRNHGWFIGFAPYENPEIVIVVLVEEGTGGSTDAVPIAKEVLYYYFTHRDNPPLTSREGSL